MSHKHNGYKNWNHWNVSLWINNEQALYDVALACIRDTTTRDGAARMMLQELRAGGIDRTPDGALYSVSSIRAAMVDM